MYVCIMYHVSMYQCINVSMMIKFSVKYKQTNSNVKQILNVKETKNYVFLRLG